MKHTYEPFWTHAMAVVVGAALMVIFLTGREPPAKQDEQANTPEQPRVVCPRTLRKMT